MCARPGTWSSNEIRVLGGIKDVALRRVGWGHREHVRIHPGMGTNSFLSVGGNVCVGGGVRHNRT